jgi:hypothetical protein
MSRQYIIDNSTEQSRIEALASDPAQVSLDVSAIDPSRLPANVRAEICTNATTFNAPQLRSSGNICANRATTFSVPQLQTSGAIWADRVKDFSAPHLRSSGDIFTSKAPTQPHRKIGQRIGASPHR